MDRWWHYPIGESLSSRIASLVGGRYRYEGTRQAPARCEGREQVGLKPGDVITGNGYQFSDGQKIIRLERIVFADGKEMRLYGR